VQDIRHVIYEIRRQCGDEIFASKSGESLNHGCHIYQIHQLSCIRLYIGYLLRQVDLDIQRCSVVSINKVGGVRQKSVNQSADLSAPATYIYYDR